MSSNHCCYQYNFLYFRDDCLSILWSWLLQYIYFNIIIMDIFFPARCGASHEWNQKGTSCWHWVWWGWDSSSVWSTQTSCWGTYLHLDMLKQKSGYRTMIDSCIFYLVCFFFILKLAHFWFCCKVFLQSIDYFDSTPYYYNIADTYVGK